MSKTLSKTLSKSEIVFLLMLHLLNDYYDKVYVLSVREAETRRKLFAERFQGLEYEFYYGADKKEFTTEDLIKKEIYSEELTRKHHRYNKSMRPGEIACAWSHKMMYQDILENHYKNALIFEDDAVPDSAAVKNISDILTEIPSGCELLFWGWQKHGENSMVSSMKKAWYHLQHSMGLLKWDYKIISNLYAKSFSKHLKKAGFHDYTYAYAISSSGAEKLLKLQQPIQYIADNLLSIAGTSEIVNAYITYPPVFLHDALPDGTARDSYIR